MFNLHHSFPGQRKDEPVFIFLRRHPLSALPLVLMFGFMIVLGIGLFYLVMTSSIFTGQIFNIALVVVTIFLLASVTFAFVALLDFYFDIHIVTNSRIVDIDQNRLFNRQIDELALNDIEDVSTVVGGFLNTIFNYGNVEIQTAGTKSNFNFENIPNPREVSQLILDLADQAKKGIGSEKRFPTSNVFGVIGSNVIRNPQEMIALGVWPADTPVPTPPEDD